MKFVKKLTCLFLAVVMTMAMGITAFAAPAAVTGPFTLTAPSDGHSYTVYQIFTGEVATETTTGDDGQTKTTTTLSNVRWGKDGKSYDSSKTTQELVSDTDLKTLTDLSSNTQATANEVYKYIASGATGTALAAGESTSLPAGYYLIKDNGSNNSDDSYSTYIVLTLKENTGFTVKRQVPTFEKKVMDVNDSTGEKSNWQDSADYDIGDAVPFKLTGTVASNYADYTKYFYQFSDQMEPSLTFDSSSVVVKIDGNTVDSSKYTLTTGTVSEEGTYKGGNSFTITFADLKQTAAVAGSTITVEYSATLNDKAVFGSTGNVNEARLKYSNNPNDSQNGETSPTGETPWDTVIVFTYKTIVNKVDQDKKPLTGAEFTLYKKVKGSDGTITEKEIKAVVATSGTQFEFKGLDDGNYVLKETKTPAGYSTAADIEFTITADHDVVWETQARTEVLNTLSGGDKFTGDVNAGTLTGSVENKKGSELPSTGGMGTTVIYVAGIAMIVVAGVVVIARKRMA